MCQTLHWVLSSEMNKAQSLCVCVCILIFIYLAALGLGCGNAGSLVETFKLFFSCGMWDLVP